MDLASALRRAADEGGRVCPLAGRAVGTRDHHQPPPAAATAAWYSLLRGSAGGVVIFCGLSRNGPRGGDMTNQPENARQKQPEGVEHRSVTQALLNEAQHVAQVGLDTVII